MREILTAARRLRIPEAQQLIEVFEALNARELVSTGQKEPIPTILARLHASPLDWTNTRIVFLVEDREALSVVALRPATGETCVARESPRLDPIVQALARFEEALPYALPGIPNDLDEALAPTLDTVGALLSEVSEEGEHLVVLPGDRLLNLPFQAATTAGRPLLKRNTLSVAPNLRTLHTMMAPGLPGKEKRAAVVVVNKENDSTEFGSFCWLQRPTPT